MTIAYVVASLQIFILIAVPVFVGWVLWTAFRRKR